MSLVTVSYQIVCNWPALTFRLQEVVKLLVQWYIHIDVQNA